MSIKAETLELANWAVVGATDKKNRFGYKIVKILKENGYIVFPINPKLDEVAGRKCFSSLPEVPEKIDVVDMVVNPKIGIEVMEEVAKEKVHYVWLQPGARSEEIRKFAEEKDIYLVEDCIYATLKE